MQNKKFTKGFTVIELVVVIVVIGILSSLVLVAYTSLQTRVIDTALASDVDKVNIAELRYKDEHGAAGKEYYSGNGFDTDLNFSPASGNIIDVVVDEDGYCIRGYHVNSSNDTIYDAVQKESSVGSCERLSPSAQAIAESPGGGSVTPVWSQISLGASHTCALTSTGKAYCWGSNASGQIGTGSSGDMPTTPVAVDDSGLSGKTFKYIAAGGDHTCAILSDNKAYCWGANGSGQLGDNTTNDSYVPKAVYTGGALNEKTIKKISASTTHTCVIASDDKAYCWGGNDGYWGSWLGNNSSEFYIEEPVAVSTSGVLSGKTLTSISVGSGFTCAIDSNQDAFCWGGNWGDNASGSTFLPFAVSMSGLNFESIDLGWTHACAINSSDNKAYCWGENNYGQLGSTDYYGSRDYPVAVDDSGVLSGVSLNNISGGGSHSCAVASDGKVYCWGLGAAGQLGFGWYDSQFPESPTYPSGYIDEPLLVDDAGMDPFPLDGLTVSNVSLGNEHTCALTNDHKIFCWGSDSNGQIGENEEGFNEYSNRYWPVIINIPS